MIIVTVGFSHTWMSAIHRAIPSVLITWMTIEILMKWEIIPKPWQAQATKKSRFSALFVLTGFYA